MEGGSLRVALLSLLTRLKFTMKKTVNVHCSLEITKRKMWTINNEKSKLFSTEETVTERFS
jgi:hypothetical protein